MKQILCDPQRCVGGTLEWNKVLIFFLLNIVNLEFKKKVLLKPFGDLSIEND